MFDANFTSRDKIKSFGNNDAKPLSPPLVPDNEHQIFRRIKQGEKVLFDGKNTKRHLRHWDFQNSGGTRLGVQSDHASKNYTSQIYKVSPACQTSTLNLGRKEVVARSRIMHRKKFNQSNCSYLEFLRSFKQTKPRHCKSWFLEFGSIHIIHIILHPTFRKVGSWTANFSPIK